MLLLLLIITIIIMYMSEVDVIYGIYTYKHVHSVMGAKNAGLNKYYEWCYVHKLGGFGIQYIKYTV